jgi:hypothetical protein
VPDFTPRRSSQTFFAPVVQDVADPVCDQDTDWQMGSHRNARAVTVTLRILAQAAHGHVFEHALPQQAYGL